MPTTPAMSRRERIIAAVDAVGIHVDQFQRSDDQYPPAAYWDSIDDAVLVFASGEMPPDLWKLYRAMERVIGWLDEHETRAEWPLIYPPVEGVDELLQARQTLDAEPLPPLPRESVIDLDKQKVPHRQICNMMGWLLPNGAPDLARVDKELTSPTGARVPPAEAPALEKMSFPSPLVFSVRAERIRQRREEMVAA